MLYERIELPTSGGETVSMEAYCPEIGDYNPQDMLRVGIIVCGGGGYSHVSQRESEPVALRFAAMGFNTYVLHYRVAPYRFPAAVQDLAAAVAWVRNNAVHFRNDPGKIAVLGFSAGGHLAGSLGTMWQRGELWAPLGLTCQDVRPNAQVLCYPVITAGEFAHRGSFEMLTGSLDAEEHQAYSLEKLVTSSTPPAFLWSTWTDGAVPCENTLLMAAALHQAKVPAEVHVFPYGHHGLSLANDVTWGGNPDKREDDCAVWPDLAAKFLHRVLD